MHARGLLVMTSDVLAESAAVRSCIFTVGALVGLLSSVSCADVGLEITLVSKCLSTPRVVALEWPLSSVSEDVPVEIKAASKCLSTPRVVALEGLLSSVSADVLFEILRFRS